jgi:RNA polymerase sigma-70 factor, ECF subfamily
MLASTVAERVTQGETRLRAETSADAETRASAFRTLMDSELDRSYGLATTILRDASEAEEAVHDAALAAWQRWDDLRDPVSAAAWFQRIVINRCRDRLRRRKLRSIFEIVRAVDEHEHPVVGAPRDPVLSEVLAMGLKRLSADERVVVALRYGDDQTMPQIAAALEVPEGTVKSRLHNAMKKLRASVRESRDA